MPQEERLSAVAKRRHLHGNILSTLNSPSIISRSQSPTKSVSQNKVHVSAAPLPTVTVDRKPDDNSFSALVSKDVVQFSNFREIEKVNNEAVKVRLSKGQKCVVSGTYCLWVKIGLIEIHGARLEASSEIHHVYAPAMFEVPAIVALNNSAEFEIHSLTDSTLLWSGFTSHEWVSQSFVDALYVSFFVHGFSVAIDGRPPIIAREFEDRLTNNVARQISQYEPIEATSSPPTILICGKQIFGTALMLTSIINTLVTTKGPTRANRYNHGAIFLDLDSEMPAFAPPKTVSLVHIRKPVLGMSFTQPGIIDSGTDTDTIKILRMQYVGRLESASAVQDRFDSLLAYTKNVWQTQYQQCPLIIKANDWLERIDSDHVPALAKNLSPDFVVCFDPEAGTNSVRLGDLVADKVGPQSVMGLPLTGSQDPPLRVQHELLLRSYFHFRGYQLTRPWWQTLPLDLDHQCQIWLTYGKESAFINTVSWPGLHVGLIDLIDALHGCIVVVVIHDHKGITEMPTFGTLKTANHKRQSKIERSAASAEGADCLGFGIVAGLSTEKQEICLLTPISKGVFETHRQAGNKIDLIAQKADPDGRFDSAWAQLELEMILEKKRLTRSVYRHRLNIKGREDM